MQVKKALHTCASWYAYAAMFGSSTENTLCSSRALVYVQSVELHRVDSFIKPCFVGHNLKGGGGAGYQEHCDSDQHCKGQPVQQAMAYACLFQ